MMGMTTYVKGLRDATDPKHVKMVSALKACLDAGITIPKELDVYFQGTHNPDAALEVQMKYATGTRDMEKYIDVSIADIPSDVKVIRFTNSW